MAVPGAPVSVGMPVFNLERTIGRAIESVLDQTYGQFELLISDNASTDGTESICRRYAALDSRIHYTRQPAVIPAWDNYRFVLDAARSPYFMWLAADDYARPRLLERATAALDHHADVVCAAAQVEFVDADGRRRPGPGTFPLLGSMRENLCRFLRDPLDNSRFYGVFRSDVLRRTLPHTAYYAFDWTVTAGTLRYGKHVQLDDLLLVRESTDPVKYMQLIDAAKGRLVKVLPLARFTRAVFGELRVPPYPCVLYALLRINAIYHVMYCLYRYRRYGRLLHHVVLALDSKRSGRGRRPGCSVRTCTRCRQWMTG